MLFCVGIKVELAPSSSSSWLRLIYSVQPVSSLVSSLLSDNNSTLKKKKFFVVVGNLHIQERMHIIVNKVNSKLLCHVCFGNDVVDVESRELTKDDTGCTL
jgi:hypothetical protein